MRFRLRFHSTEIDLPPGESVIGRAVECFVRLDDAMVSRRHACLRVTESEATIEDLGSRNGVTLNGQRLRERATLRPHDRIGVGHEEFTFLTEAEARRGRTITGRFEVTRCAGCGETVPVGLTPCPTCGRRLPMGRDEETAITLTGRDTYPSPILTGEASAEDGAHAVLYSVGDKALALGRVEEAERILGGSLRDFQSRIQRGHRSEMALLEPAMQRALRLAGATSKAEWFNWIFEVAAALKIALPSAIIDELHMLMFQHKPAVGAALDSYLGALPPASDPDTQFQLKRIAALRRFCRE